MSDKRCIDQIANWLCAMGFAVDWQSDDPAPACLLHPYIEACLREGTWGDSEEEVIDLVMGDQRWAGMP